MNAGPSASKPVVGGAPLHSRARAPKHFLSLRPRLGNVRFPEQARRSLALVLEGVPYDALFLSHSYLAATLEGPSLPSLPTIVDFPNIEHQRMASLTAGGAMINRASAALESLKARAWEPRVARRASLCLACTESDRSTLERWGARVELVPHGSFTRPAPRSPEDGYVLLVASGDYGPNVHGIKWFLSDVWPLIVAMDAGARLVVVGRNSDRVFGRFASPNVEIVGEVDDIEQYYSGAALAVAPVSSGGGAQLKVSEALAAGRIIVGTPFSARSAPVPARGGYVSVPDADAFASAVVELRRDAPRRHNIESSVVAASAVPTWEQSCLPIVRFIERTVGIRG